MGQGKRRYQCWSPVNPPEPNHSEHAAPAIFATTRWTVVLRARDTSDDLGRAALEQLCRAYWRPLRAFALRAGHSPEDAEDFTQDFFVRLLSRDALSNVSPDKGRFRNFLLVAFRNFLADQRDKAQTAKRGGGVRPLSLSQTSADGDSDAAPEPTAAATPEQAFERQWAHTLLHRARIRLRAECVANERLALYEALGPEDTQASAGEESYEQLGQRLGLSIPALKSAAFRLRKRYRELIRDEVAETVTSTDEVEEELRHMLRVLER